MFKLKIPATTANMGAGFDAFGMALGLYNYLTVVDGGNFKGVKISNVGQECAALNDPKRNLVTISAQRVFDLLGYVPNGLEFIVENNIPVSRGLGSSSAAIVGGLFAANQISGNKLSREDLLEIAVDIEGHPDNVCPAIYGGFVVSCRREGERTIMLKAVPPKKLSAVVAIPDFHLSTKVAREAMPKEISIKDAVFNIQCASILVGAMVQGDLELFSKVVDDRLHQPYRFPLIKGAYDVLNAAKEAGAIATALSGAGPTLIAFTDGDGKKIAQAMEAAWRKHDIKAEALALAQDNCGVHII